MDFAQKDFKKFIEQLILPLMQQYNLSNIAISNGIGDTAKLKKDKHGFIKINITTTTDFKG